MQPGGTTTLRWRELPLDGRVLIEASAGTGKTWTIGVVYLRLLLERGLGVERILVTTFTEAAAQELRERLRRRLAETEQWLQHPAELEAAGAHAAATGEVDSLPAWLAGQAGDPERARQALRRIQLARADFDRAPIATIHALCQRIQREFPLEAGAAFRSERLVDEAELLHECVEDFWRRRYFERGLDPGEHGVLDEGPESLTRDLHAIAGSGAAAVLDADGKDALDAALEGLQAPGIVRDLRGLSEDAGLFARSNAALRTCLRAIADVLETARREALAKELAGAFSKCFDDDWVDAQQGPRPATRLRAHPLIRRLIALAPLLGWHKTFARGRVLAAAHAECIAQVRERAQRRGVKTFSMLIDGVHERLCGESGAQLAARLFEAFPAALIDEFQDTDQRQYAIFDRIYRTADDAPRGTLVMIGDPKQAIYGFRGGDIAAYLRAAAQAGLRHALGTNHRSATALVGALNALYGGDGGFGRAAIDYRAVAAAGRADQSPWTIDGEPVAEPLLLHAFRCDATDSKKGKPLEALGALEELALDDCAARIAAQLMDGRQRIGGRRVLPGDIAVLLPTNRHVLALRERLVRRGVPCVGSGRGSVFDGEVAAEFERVFAGVLAADDEGAVRAALSTRLLGARFAEFEAWRTDAASFERELERFARWRALARSRGVLALVADLLAQRGAGLLAAQGGERCVTDLRHLGELLAERQPQEQGLEGLFAWFARMRSDGGDGEHDAGDARQLRIESDAARVQLMTVHAAKGLEFPIVYLPLAWRIAMRAGNFAPKVLRFHDDAGRLVVDVGSAGFATNLARHHREDLDERLRLLYVAMTRAVHALHVYWVQRKSFPGEGDPPDERACDVAAIDLLVAQAQRRLGVAPGEGGLHALASRLEGVALVDVPAPAAAMYEPPAPPPRTYATRTPLPALRAFEWQHSFSAIARGATAAAFAEAGAADEVAAAVDLAEPESSGDDPRLVALQALRGPRFGDAVHRMFELATPGPLWPVQRALVARELHARGFRLSPADGVDLLEQVARMVERSRGADLDGGLRLADIAHEARVSEFEFQLPLRHVTIARLRAVCAAHGVADAVPATLEAQRLNGLLAGFVDLVFEWRGRYHVLDYKTNWLGADLAGYRDAGLDAAMRTHHYPLQALLYSVAVHRYLRRRLRGYSPAQHLGDSWYVFVRAVGLAAGAGVWRRRWPVALIEALDELFAGACEDTA